MKETTTLFEIQDHHKSILKMFLYFDIFQYPLNINELSLSVDNTQLLHEGLDQLKSMGLVNQHNDFYYLADRTYTKRISEKTNADHFYKKARTYATLINRFPFVRGVYISGSLSKDWADDTTDVDYFIITAPERLWICRTMLILFKKIFLLNSRKYFCLNYFIDTEHLEIEEKNIFTATEVSFLKPMINQDLYHEFLEKNQWVAKYYPQKYLSVKDHLIDHKNGAVKLGMEKILSGTLGERLDIWSMKRTLKFWRKKFPGMTNNDFHINFKTNRTISKHHPSGFQKRVMEALEIRVQEFENLAGVSLR